MELNLDGVRINGARDTQNQEKEAEHNPNSRDMENPKDLSHVSMATQQSSQPQDFGSIGNQETPGPTSKEQIKANSVSEFHPQSPNPPQQVKSSKEVKPKKTKGQGEMEKKKSGEKDSIFQGGFDMEKLAQVAANIPGQMKKKEGKTKVVGGGGGGDGDYEGTVGPDVAHMIRTAEEAGLIPEQARFYSTLRVRAPEGSDAGSNAGGTPSARTFFPLRGYQEGTDGESSSSKSTPGQNQLQFFKTLAEASRNRPQSAAPAPTPFDNSSSSPQARGTGLRLSAQGVSVGSGTKDNKSKSPAFIYPDPPKASPSGFLSSTSRLLRPTTSSSAKYSVNSPVPSGSDISISGLGTKGPTGTGSPKGKTTPTPKTSRVSSGSGSKRGIGIGTPSPKNLSPYKSPVGKMGDSAGGDGSGSAGGAGTPVPPSLKEQFGAFSRFGDATSDGKQITLSNCDKWMKQAHVIDGKKITTTDTSIAFKKLFKTAKKIGFEDFKRYVDDVASSKKLESKDIQEKLTKCGLPGLSTATKAAHVGVVERLTDTSKYTGSHKERFDASGKGKGLEGRRDVADGSGYVAAFKEKLEGQPSSPGAK